MVITFMASYFTVVDVREPRSSKVAQTFQDSVNFWGALNESVSPGGNFALVVGPHGDSVAAAVAKPFNGKTVQCHGPLASLVVREILLGLLELERAR